MSGQRHDGVGYTFDSSKAKYDSALKVWYQDQHGASWVCMRNPNADRLVGAGINLAYSFGHARAGVNHGDYAGERAFGSTFARNLFEGAANNSCFVCGLIRWKKGCFPPGVKILMGDGATEKNVEDVSVGDLLWNPQLKKGARVLRISQGPEKMDIVVVHAGSMKLRVSGEHPVLTMEGMRQAQRLVVGSVVTDNSGKRHKVTEITHEKATPGLTVINFILEREGGAEDGLLVADGVVVGDLLVQHLLSSSGR